MFDFFYSIRIFISYVFNLKFDFLVIIDYNPQSLGTFTEIILSSIKRSNILKSLDLISWNIIDDFILSQIYIGIYLEIFLIIFILLLILFFFVFDLKKKHLSLNVTKEYTFRVHHTIVVQKGLRHNMLCVKRHYSTTAGYSMKQPYSIFKEKHIQFVLNDDRSYMLVRGETNYKAYFLCFSKIEVVLNDLVPK